MTLFYFEWNNLLEIEKSKNIMYGQKHFLLGNVLLMLLLSSFSLFIIVNRKRTKKVGNLIFSQWVFWHKRYFPIYVGLTADVLNSYFGVPILTTV